MSIAERDFITALYRGVLNREPDEVGLGLHLQALREGADPERALVHSLQLFLASDEFRNRYLSEDLLHRLSSQFDEPTGPVFEHVASLGTHCYASWALKQEGLKRYSLPFDWIFSTLSMVRHCIEDDFHTFLDRSHHGVTPLSDRPRPDEDVGWHRFYEEEFGVRSVFNHQDPTDDAMYAYFERAAERFRRLLASPAPKLFLAIANDRRIEQGDFERLAATLDRLSTNLRLLVIRVLEPSNTPALYGFSPLAEVGAHRLVKFQPTSHLLGLGFARRFDDFLIRGQLRTMRYNLRDSV